MNHISFKSIFVAFFIFILILPTFIKEIGIYSSSNTENRILSSPPEWKDKALKDFSKEFDIYFKENFGGRDIFYKIYNYILLNFFNSSPLSERVIIGHGGWYFLGNFFSNEANESIGLNKFSNEEKQKILLGLQNKKKQLDSLGIQSYFCIAQNKSSIYPEYLPYKVINTTSKFLDLQYFLKRNNVNLINLTRDIAELKKTQQVYDKGDSHWNEYGAYSGYRLLMDEILKNNIDAGIKVAFANDLLPSSKENEWPDLYKIFNQSKKDTTLTLEFINPPNIVTIPNKLLAPQNHFNPSFYEYRYFNNLGTKKVIIIRDSYMTRMMKFCNYSFNETIYLWSGTIDMNIIKAEKPDIVIFESVEREIESLLSW
jgi:hypothetical protein